MCAKESELLETQICAFIALSRVIMNTFHFSSHLEYKGILGQQSKYFKHQLD